MSLPLKLRCEMAISAAGVGSSHLGVFLKQMQMCFFGSGGMQMLI